VTATWGQAATPLKAEKQHSHHTICIDVQQTSHPIKVGQITFHQNTSTFTINIIPNFTRYPSDLKMKAK